MVQSGGHLKDVAAFGKEVDFGKTAQDYGRYRAGYPDELYRRLERFERPPPRRGGRHDARAIAGVVQHLRVELRV